MEWLVCNMVSLHFRILGVSPEAFCINQYTDRTGTNHTIEHRTNPTSSAQNRTMPRGPTTVVSARTNGSTAQTKMEADSGSPMQNPTKNYKKNEKLPIRKCDCIIVTARLG